MSENATLENAMARIKELEKQLSYSLEERERLFKALHEFASLPSFMDGNVATMVREAAKKAMGVTIT